jgi:hypothetical protein
MDTIILHHTPTGWMADFKDDERVRRLFGGTMIPTAFTARAPAQQVLQAIQSLNPTSLVQIEV